MGILCQRAKGILQDEGWGAFIRQGFSFACHRFIYIATYYIYEETLASIDRGIKTKPEVDCVLKVIHNTHELDKLIGEGYNFKSLRFRSQLQETAIAFCLFREQELASVTWVAHNKKGKRKVDSLPFEVNFGAGEICTGDSYTVPVYRGKGLLAYTYACISNYYLASNGLSKARFSINVNNITSQKAHVKFNPVVIGKGRFLKILWWNFWKEQVIEVSDG